MTDMLNIEMLHQSAVLSKWLLPDAATAPEGDAREVAREIASALVGDGAHPQLRQRVEMSLHGLIINARG